VFEGLKKAAYPVNLELSNHQTRLMDTLFWGKVTGVKFKDRVEVKEIVQVAA